MPMVFGRFSLLSLTFRRGIHYNGNTLIFTPWDGGERQREKKGAIL